MLPLSGSIVALRFRPDCLLSPAMPPSIGSAASGSLVSMSTSCGSGLARGGVAVAAAGVGDMGRGRR